jgi:YggT family protein
MESGLIALIDSSVLVVSIILLAHALMSFAPLEPWHPVRRTIAQIAEPIVQPFRNLLPPVGMFDFSIMIALLAMQLGGELLKALIRAVF